MIAPGAEAAEYYSGARVHGRVHVGGVHALQGLRLDVLLRAVEPLGPDANFWHWRVGDVDPACVRLVVRPVREWSIMDQEHRSFITFVHVHVLRRRLRGATAVPGAASAAPAEADPRVEGAPFYGHGVAHDAVVHGLGADSAVGGGYLPAAVLPVCDLLRGARRAQRGSNARRHSLRSVWRRLQEHAHGNADINFIELGEDCEVILGQDFVRYPDQHYRNYRHQLHSIEHCHSNRDRERVREI